jgi:hypothetical protein
MKKQYFGDINDYKKYSLIRQLSNFGELKTEICWMLTPNDPKKKEGFQTGYLKKPDEWEKYDKPLFKYLQSNILRNQSRGVYLIEKGNILPKCKFFNDCIPENGEHRKQYSQKLLLISNGKDLIFFDPDIGLETSVKCGNKRSSQYLYWSEVKAAYEMGLSVLIYQHRHRSKKAENMAEYLRNQAIKQHFSPMNIFIYNFKSILFLLIGRDEHIQSFKRANKTIEQIWGKKLAILYPPP